VPEDALPWSVSIVLRKTACVHFCFSSNAFLFFIEQCLVDGHGWFACGVKDVAEQVLAASLRLGVLVPNIVPLFVILEGGELGWIMFDTLFEISDEVLGVRAEGAARGGTQMLSTVES
jgi:hypothetical protein